MQRIAFVFALLALASTATAQVIVIPNGTAATEGNSSNAFPWGRGGGGIRIQCIYDTTHFTLQGVTGPVMITRLRWRPNTNVSSATSTYQTAKVSLSTCPLDQGVASTTYATNRGPDLRVVWDDQVSWPAATAVPGPCPFLIDIPLQHNFIYDPTVGDLNIECDMPIQTFTGTGLQLDVQTTAPLASHMFLTTGYVNGGPNATGTLTINHGVVVEVTCIPAVGLFADFTASVRTGTTPLMVNFTDQTFSSAGPITSWSWDFDGDAIVDSTLQNPTFTYTTCGTFTPSLTVTNGVNPPRIKAFANHIVTDDTTASFTYALTSSTTVQFTDTTTPAATSWSWDLNGDTVPDSTLQNPTFTYPSGCQPPTNVTLTVNRLCRGPFSVTRSVRPAVTLQTFNNGGTTGSVGGGTFFDVNVANPQGVTVCSMDTKTSATSSTAITVEVYRASGTFVGKELQAAAWQMIATGTATGIGSGATFPNVPVTLSNRFHLPFGVTGMFVRIVTGGAPQVLTTANVVANTDMTITLGSLQATPFVSAVTAARTWCGAFHYTTTANAGTAGYGTFGAGCAGTMPVSRITTNGPPQLGQTLQLTFNNLPISAAFLIYGFSRTASAFGPLPLNLTPLGAPGCFGRVSVDSANFILGAANQVTSSLNIPNNAILLAQQFNNQAMVIDPAFNALGGVISDAGAGIIGNN